jgi:LuxR family maltose regulon positive regulatory protein
MLKRRIFMAEQVFHSNVPVAFKNQLLIDRPQLTRLLEEASEKPVVCVSAGAGYGKTQAVYSFIRKTQVRTAWLQLSERDNISDHFWENFIAALRTMSPETAAKLARIGFPETERGFDRYLSIPQEDVIPNEKFIFVYDDAHLLKDKAVLRFIERSVITPFPTVSSIFISRSEIPINLMRFESKGRLARIGEEELRFSRKELEEYLALRGLRPSPETVSAIYRDTEGWAFAIYLAGLSLEKAPGGAYVSSAMKSNIFKFIESEIISNVSGEFRKFLISLSLITDHLSPDLLAGIPGSGGGEAAGELAKAHSFIRFDIYRNVYHIHHLLLDYLSRFQKELSEEEKRAVYVRAAEWCAENDQKIDALSYYEKCGDYGGIMKICFNMPLTLPKRTGLFLLGIFDRASRKLFEIPAAYIVYTRLLMSLSMLDRAVETLRSVIAALETGGPYDAAAARTIGGCYTNLGFAGLLTSTYTRDYSYVRYFEKAVVYSKISGYESKPPVSVITLSSYVCRAATAENGEMVKYNRAFASAVPSIALLMGGCCYGVGELAEAELAFFKNSHVEAEEAALKALVKARERDQYEVENRALFFLLRIRLKQGDLEGLKDIEGQLEAQMDKEFYLNRFIYHDILFGWLKLQLGQGELIARWLKSDFEESEFSSLIYGLELLVKVKYLFAVKRPQAAAALLESHDEKYSSGDFVLGKLERKTLEAVCRYQLQDREGAYGALAAAWELARPELLVMPFIELGKDMKALLEAALRDGFTGIPLPVLEDLRRNASLYAKKLFIITEKYRAASRRSGRVPAGRGLSRRELDVLKGLSQGLTREEIAGASSISVNTVKSTIRIIYNKLGALNRVDAVRKAEAGGLLKD